MPNNDIINIEPGACGLPGCNCRADLAASRAAEEARQAATSAPVEREDGEAEAEPTCDECGEDESDCDCFTCSPGMRREHQVTSDRHMECCGSCDDHCECSECEGCGRRNPSLTLCGECDGCHDRCCDCWSCDDCGSTYRAGADRCSNCETCPDCCGCSGDSDDPDEGDGVRGDSPRMFSLPLTFHRGRPAKALASSRYAAVEIEVQGAASTAHHGPGSLYVLASTKWGFSVVRDGSLGSYGFEINTSPASGTKFIEQVNDICGVLNANSARVDRACGLHIHLDGRSLTPVEVLRFARVSNAIRDAVGYVLPSSRHDNTYCREYPGGFERALAKYPLGDDLTERFINLGRAVYGSGSEATRDDINTVDRVGSYSANKYGRGDERYWWVNLHSWFHRGTIEIRSHSGTTSARKITMWAAFWCGLLDRVCRMTDEGAAMLVADAARDQWAVFLRLCPSADVARFYAERRQTFSRVGYTAADDDLLKSAVENLNTPVKRAVRIININVDINEAE